MTQMLSGSDLAKEMGVSKARVSQWTSEGKLNGCFSGAGRDRRYDLGRVAEALGRRLDPGQLMGNGAGTRAVLKTIQLDLAETGDEGFGASAAKTAAPKPQKADTELGKGDADRYEMARTQKAEEEARRLRRMNAEAEGRFVLATEVGRQVAQLMGQQVAEVEAVLRDGARLVADRLGVDFKVVRQLLTEEWRRHRALRSGQLAIQGDGAELTPAEAVEDI